MDGSLNPFVAPIPIAPPTGPVPAGTAPTYLAPGGSTLEIPGAATPPAPSPYIPSPGLQAIINAQAAIASAPGVGPAPPGLTYTGKTTGGLPASAATGLASIVPVLEMLLGSIGAVLFAKLLSGSTSITTSAAPTPAPAKGTTAACAQGEFVPPCRPHEQLDAGTGCCSTICPSGEYAQPCRPNETVDVASNCCQAAATAAKTAAMPGG